MRGAGDGDAVSDTDAYRATLVSKIENLHALLDLVRDEIADHERALRSHDYVTNHAGRQGRTGDTTPSGGSRREASERSPAAASYPVGTIVIWRRARHACEMGPAQVITSTTGPLALFQIETIVGGVVLNVSPDDCELWDGEPMPASLLEHAAAGLSGPVQSSSSRSAAASSSTHPAQVSAPVASTHEGTH